MKNKTIAFIVAQIIALLICTSTLHAWTGDTWGPISRETILRIADEMVDFSWTPKNTINNWNYGSVWKTFNAGTVYWGEAYTQENPQDNWAEFYSLVNNTTGGDTKYGNDCSGFVSMSWKLPTRYTTASFESDATSDGGYVTSLGAIGSGNVGLLPGDAFVKSGSHIILFESYLYDQGIKVGINAIEQTSIPSEGIYWARRTNKYTWNKLSTYRPIRRNNIDEGDYVFKTKWGSQGTGNGQFDFPSGIAVDSSGSVYIADTANDRIQKFNSNGGFITKWGSYGTGNGQFDGPWGIGIDSSGNVYVADSYNNRIQKFNSSGGFITKWSYIWSGSFPVDIAVDSSMNVYVVDKTYDNIQKYTSSGSFITEWGSYGTGNGQFDFPSGIAVDSSGSVYIADTANDRIQKFNSNGGFITKWGSYGTGNGQFDGPWGIGIDSSGNVYVADTLNDRIQKFAPVSPFPSAPSNFTATAVSTTQINLSWQDNSNNETGFKIKRKIGVNGTYSTIATVGANITGYSDTDVAEGNKYYYAVWAYNSAGESVYSNEARVSTGAPFSPSNLTVSAVSSTQIALSWTDNSDNEEGFKIDRTIESGGTYSQIATVSANVTTYTDTELTPTTTYYYRVNAYNAAGDSNYSNEADTITFANAPPVSNPNGPYSGIEGQAITLDGSGSTDSDGSIELYEWDIDNNGTYDYSSSSPTQSHTYAQQDTYTIRLRVTDNFGATDEATTTVTISDTSPTANFTGSPTWGEVSLTVDFTNNSTGYDQPLSYEWDFDNNGTIDSTAQNPSYTYINQGTYTVKLTVTDSDGSTNTLTRTDYITVTPPVYTLTVNVNGNGTVTSLPAGIDCGTDCTEGYYEGTVVTLTVVPDAGFTFTGWTGCDSVSNNVCTVTMNADTPVTATFEVCSNPPVRIAGTYYSTLQAAYDAAVDGDTIQSQAARFIENLNINRNISITLEGGYDCDYTTDTGKTRLNGTMTLSNGTLTTGNFILEK